MTVLPATGITVAQAATVLGTSLSVAGVRSVTIEAQFTYGSGGTKTTAYVQTSLDGGVTWVDIACFTFLTASLNKVMTVNAATSIVASYTATDGSLADDTAKDGILGDRFRVKLTTTGTYAGGTTLAIFAHLRN
jgi:hypothetical protein